MTIDNENKKAEGKAELAAAFRSISVELYNKEHNAAKALDSIGKACELDPGNSLYLYERDCLLEEVGSDPVVRLSLLEGKDDLIAERDELSLNYAHVLNLNSRIDEAMDIILGRDFSLDAGGTETPDRQQLQVHDQREGERKHDGDRY